MAKITFRGLEEYISALERLSVGTDMIIKKSVYPGAKIVADSIKASAEAIHTRPSGKMYRGGEMAPGPRADEKADMIASFGLAPMRNDNGYINTKAGFDGYGRHETESFPRGVPNALVARSCEAGTSWMRKQPFVRKAVNSARSAAVEACRKAFDEETRNIMN